MFAVVEINGFQYKVKENDKIRVSKINNSEKGEKIEFENVLLIKEDGNTVVGKPYIDGAKIVCSNVGDVKGKKIEVMKYKRRKNYKRIKGHKQDYTEIIIEKIIRP